VGDGVRTHPAAEAPGCSPLEAGVVEEEIFGAVAAVDEDECPACVPEGHISHAFNMIARDMRV